nr:hypothetical protein YSBCXYJI_YSBCXYJI_CDS_0143 [Caudoviricetes sp.]
MPFFGHNSDILARNDEIINIWKFQVLLSKTCNISIDISNNFTLAEFKLSLDALKEINEIMYGDKNNNEYQSF